MTTVVPQIIYKMEYNKTKAKGYTLPYDTPHQQLMKKVKDMTSNVSRTQATFSPFSSYSGVLCVCVLTLYVCLCVLLHHAVEVQRSV